MYYNFFSYFLYRNTYFFEFFCNALQFFGLSEKDFQLFQQSISKQYHTSLLTFRYTKMNLESRDNSSDSYPASVLSPFSFHLSPFSFHLSPYSSSPFAFLLSPFSLFLLPFRLSPFTFLLVPPPLSPFAFHLSPCSSSPFTFRLSPFSLFLLPFRLSPFTFLLSQSAAA